MNKSAIWKWMLLAFLVAFSVYVVSRGINLGLDLKGGSSFVVQIVEAELKQDLAQRNPEWDETRIAEALPAEIKKAQSRALEVIRSRIDSMGVREPSIYAERDNRIVIQLPGISKATQREAERQILEVGFLSLRLVHKDNEKLVQELWDKGWAPDGYKIESVSDERRGRDTYYVRVRGKNAVGPTTEELDRFHAPTGYDFKLIHRTINGQDVYEPCFVHQRWEMKGDYIDRAEEELGSSFGEPLVKLRFDGQGKRLFREVTKKYAPGGTKNLDSESGRRLGIVLDNTLYSAPVIQTVIHDGEAQIEGIPSLEEARHLANVMQAGSLPARVEIVEKNEVDASLGQDSIQSGLRAVWLAGAGVLVFMLGYYFLCGVIADIAVILDLVLFPAGMVIAAGFLGILAGGGLSGQSAITLPVLTLPGLAGIALTLGMAVDANVLIYERMREEAKLGKNIKATIAAGYNRAFLAIWDSNLTTLITGVILFVMGSGPVRGYAVTLSAGILVSMYTAIIVTRMIFDMLSDSGKITKLRMLSIIRETNINFLAKGPLAIAVSLVIILGTWGFMAVKYRQDPGIVLGVDFTGGASVTFRVASEATKPPVAAVRDTLAGAGIREANIQYKRPMNEGDPGYLLVRAGSSLINGKTEGAIVKDTLLAGYSAQGLSEGVEQQVGPQVGAELRNRAILALGLALLGMVIYLSLRFEFSYAVGAIVALLHDVLVTAGIYVVCGRQINMQIVAILMTIIGYSVNDTIVIFDRIREDLKNSELRRSLSYRDICNLSVNQTLGRTILTGLATLVAVTMMLFGGQAINDIAFCLFIGVITGMYSTVFIATPVMLLWHREKAPVAKA